jgi:hypothetical protein
LAKEHEKARELEKVQRYHMPDVKKVLCILLKKIKVLTHFPVGGCCLLGSCIPMKWGKNTEVCEFPSMSRTSVQEYS